MVFSDWRRNIEAARSLEERIIQELKNIKESGETIVRAANSYLRNPSALFTTSYSYLFEEEVK